MLERRDKLEARLKGTSARGPARGRRRKQAEEKLDEIQRAVDAIGTGIVVREQNRRARARERRRKSLQQLEAARTAMTQRKDVHARWVIKTFGTLVDDLKSGTVSLAPLPLPARSDSSDPDPQVDLGILQRLGFVQPRKMLGDQLGWPEAWVPNQKGGFTSLSTCATVAAPVRYF